MTRQGDSGGLHGCSQSVAGQPSAPAISSNIVAPSIDFADDVGVSGVAADLLDEVEQHPANGPRLDVVGIPRHALGHRHVGVERGAAHDRCRLRGDIVHRLQGSGQRAVGGEAEPVLVGRFRLRLVPNRAAACTGAGDQIDPTSFHLGDMGDEPADAQ